MAGTKFSGYLGLKHYKKAKKIKHFIHLRLAQRPQSFNTYHLTTIGGPWYFDRAVVPQRLINQSLYQEILLLQKFIDISGKVLKSKKIQPPTSEKKK